jgi:hypothetical protein
MKYDKPIYVVFGTPKLEKEFDKLAEGKFQDKELHDFIDRARHDIKKNPMCGTKIPKQVWPKEYIKNYSIANLWKYDLPNSWRLIYTIKEDEVIIINVVLEWFDHKGYERRFNY